MTSRNKIVNLLIFISLNISFFLIFFIFYKFENKYFLLNDITPWDGAIFKDIIKGFLNESHTVGHPHFLDPHSDKLLYLLITGFIHKTLNISIINTMFFVNIVSTYLLFIITFYFLGYFKKNYLLQIILTIVFFVLWNSHLRFTIYNPSHPFAFTTLIITLSTMSIFFLIDKKNYFLLIIPFILLACFQRYMVIASLLLTISLLLLFSVNNFKNQFFNEIKYYLNLGIVGNYKSLLKKILFILFIVIITVFFLKSLSINTGLFSFAKIVIKFSYFHMHPLEFLYSFYFAFGSLFFIFIANMLTKKLRDNFFFNFKNLSTLKKIILISIFFNSVLLANIGGDDSSRYLLWFSPWYILLFYFSIINLIRFFSVNKLLFIIPIFILSSRLFVPGIPIYNFAVVFADKSQYAFTNFDDKYFYGPKFMKRFRNEIEFDMIKILPLYYGGNKKEIIVGMPKLLIEDGKVSPYIFPYKYRINDIPFPLGYLHNQKNALIDHPWHGKPWVRFVLILQWLVLQLLFFFILKKDKKYE